MSQLDQAQHYLAQLRQLTLKPSLLLFAGLMLRDERPADPLGEASYLVGLEMGQQICQNDPQALQLGTDG